MGDAVKANDRDIGRHADAGASHGLDEADGDLVARSIDGGGPVVGRKEAAEGTVSIRRLGSKDQTVLPLSEALDALSSEAEPPA